MGQRTLQIWDEACLTAYIIPVSVERVLKVSKYLIGLVIRLLAKITFEPSSSCVTSWTLWRAESTSSGTQTQLGQCHIYFSVVEAQARWHCCSIPCAFGYFQMDVMLCVSPVQNQEALVLVTTSNVTSRSVQLVFRWMLQLNLRLFGLWAIFRWQLSFGYPFELYVRANVSLPCPA